MDFGGEAHKLDPFSFLMNNADEVAGYRPFGALQPEEVGSILPHTSGTNFFRLGETASGEIGGIEMGRDVHQLLDGTDFAEFSHGDVDFPNPVTEVRAEGRTGLFSHGDAALRIYQHHDRGGLLAVMARFMS